MPTAAGTAARPAESSTSHPWPLKRGQRFPTEAEKDAALEARVRERHGPGFPWGPNWELVPAVVERWARHNFAWLRGDSTLYRSGIDPGANELSLLLLELDYWRSVDPDHRPPLHEFLREGREDWGWLGALMREYLAALDADEEFEGDDDAEGES